ncbi:MAG TPA: hypothetical protein QF764_10795 [Planctomycetota bacterium]|nr:hypothetical protein [Planctomycetota bacterium]
MSPLRDLIFPPAPRDFAPRRAVKIVLRAVHVLCAGILTGAFVFEVAAAAREPWLAATVASGAALLLLDLHESGVFLLQVRGVIVLLKIGALCALLALPALEAAAAGIMVTIVLLSVVFSHAPSNVRYRVLLFADRVSGARTKG